MKLFEKIIESRNSNAWVYQKFSFDFISNLNLDLNEA